MTLRQVAVRLVDNELELIDGLIEEERFEDRTDFIRQAVHALVDAEVRRKAGEAIVAGYRAVPWTDMSDDDWGYSDWKAAQRAAG